MKLPFGFLDERPIVIAIAGSNGAGKSTFYETFLADSGLRFVNADAIAAALNLSAYEAAEVAQSFEPRWPASGRASSSRPSFRIAFPILPQSSMCTGIEGGEAVFARNQNVGLPVVLDQQWSCMGSADGAVHFPGHLTGQLVQPDQEAWSRLMVPGEQDGIIQHNRTQTVSPGPYGQKTRPTSKSCVGDGLW